MNYNHPNSSDPNSSALSARSAALPLQDGDLLAAIDLGSNSFHMVVARYVLGQLRTVDRLREMVRLAEGLDGKGPLKPEVRQRALECLARFGQRLRDIPPQRIRAVATNTVRQLVAPQAFLMPAETALGHAIEVISGREEARLVYLGVAHAQPPKPDQLRLVIDIGGGSTECIIGSGLDALERESLQAGCVASTRRFFADGKLSKKRWKEALTEVTAEFQQFAGVYRHLGWDEALGSSGTNRAIGDICAAMKLTKGAVTAEALAQVRDRLLAAGRIDNIDLPSLSTERRPIIAGGILVLEAAFDALGLQRMAVSKAALREGVLYDMLGRGSGADPRGADRTAPVRPRRAVVATGAGRSPVAVLGCTPARARPRHRPQPVPRARRLRAGIFRHRGLLAAGTTHPVGAGAHPPSQHSEVRLRRPTRAPARVRAPQRRAAAPGGIAASLA